MSKLTDGTRPLRLALLLAAFILLFCIGCAAQREVQPSSSEPQAFLPSAAEAFAASSEPEVFSLPEESSLSEDSFDPLEANVEALLSVLKEEAPDAADRDFLRYVGDTFGADCLPALAEAIGKEGYTDTLWRQVTGNTLQVLRSLYAEEPQALENVRLLSLGTPGSGKTTVMTFGGDICFADNYLVMQYLETTENGLSDCLAPEWFSQMQNADIAMLNNEFTISDRGEPMANKAFTFRAATENTALYQELGVDFVTLANNHAYDFGEDAFLDTLQALKSYGIDYAGGGRNAEEAQRPFYYLVDGRKIAFVSATRAEKYILTPEAGENTPGVFRCYEPDRLKEVLAEAKQNSDYVVLFIHWGTEHSAALERVQETTSHEYIDAGADLIIGSHAHQLQGIEFYKGKAIFYNLGNFWFDGYPIETGLIRFEWKADGTECFYFLPGMQENCVTSYELGTETGRQILDHLASYLPGIQIDDDGLVTEK